MEINFCTVSRDDIKEALQEVSRREYLFKEDNYDDYMKNIEFIEQKYKDNPEALNKAKRDLFWRFCFPKKRSF